MIVAILYVLGVFAILLVLDFERGRHADRCQQVIPRHPASGLSTALPRHKKGGPVSAEPCNDKVWKERDVA